jgi:protein-S-isoprenylcysteine O-methyltransferase Ste14
MGDTPRDVAGVVAPPPLILLGSILLGVLVQWWRPVQILSPDIADFFAYAAFISAVPIFIAALRSFSAADTPVETRQPTRAIATTGPYRFTRNPIYLALLLIHIGTAFLANSVWVLATAVLTLLGLTKGAIEREERYLERRFGDEYLHYKRSVRRWL